MLLYTYLFFLCQKSLFIRKEHGDFTGFGIPDSGLGFAAFLTLKKLSGKNNFIVFLPYEKNKTAYYFYLGYGRTVFLQILLYAKDLRLSRSERYERQENRITGKRRKAYSPPAAFIRTTGLKAPG